LNVTSFSCHGSGLNLGQHPVSFISLGLLIFHLFLYKL
jgi:hypothetical protein